MTEGKRRWSRIQDGGIMRAESGQCTGAAAKMEEEGLGNMGTGSQTADGAGRGYLHTLQLFGGAPIDN